MTMIDNFKEAAALMRSRQGFDGTMLKFSKEAGWLAGKDGESMNDVEMLALVNDMMRGYVLWIDKKPTDYYVGFVRDHYEPPRRDQLHHNDKRRWRNQKDDPWQYTCFLPLIDLENENQLYVYSTTSGGGKDALANLIDAYVHNVEHHSEDANKLPLVTLARDHYTHASYGKVAIPLLDIVKWIEPPAELKPIMPPASSSTLLIDQAGNAKLIEHVPEPKNDMNDEIPF